MKAKSIGKTIDEVCGQRRGAFKHAVTKRAKLLADIERERIGRITAWQRGAHKPREMYGGRA